MQVPSRIEAEDLLREAALLNPGPWVAHSRVAAQAAERIAGCCSGLEPEAAYVLGLLHDIGRRYGVTGLRHIIDGHNYLQGLGYGDAARISLTHSFPLRDICAFSGRNDCSPEETALIIHYLHTATYDDYDALIQLCDYLAYPGGICTVEKTHGGCCVAIWFCCQDAGQMAQRSRIA